MMIHMDTKYNKDKLTRLTEKGSSRQTGEIRIGTWTGIEAMSMTNELLHGRAGEDQIP